MILIAEIGWNHMGDMALLARMVKSARESGATHAKFQTWQSSGLKSGPWDSDGRREIYRKAELSLEQFREVKRICDENGIRFLTSIFGSRDAEPMASVSADEVKIPSHEIANVRLIEAAARHFGTIYLSTGASREKEVDEAIAILKRSGREFVLLHCVSTYPCRDENVNLPRLAELRKRHHRIGLSDHTPDILSSIIALGAGATVIEKHFTIDNDLPGRDNKFAILPPAMAQLADAMRRFELMNRYHGFDHLPGEAETVSVYRGRWAPYDYPDAV